MDILTIAAREGNRAYEAAETNEEKFDAYRKAHAETLKRGRRAEEIIGAGLVSPNGGASGYYVHSQNGGSRYHVDVDAGTCTCPDHEKRGSYCKHLQAAELFAHNEEEPRDPMAPDYEALGNEPEAGTAAADSADAAGIPNYYTTGEYTRIHHHGLSEEDWERADYYNDRI